MPGLDPGIDPFPTKRFCADGWIAGSSPAMTTDDWLRPPLGSELHADPAIDRIGPPAPQRNGEADEAPEQGVLVAAIEPRKSSLPIEHRDDQHFHRGGRGEEAGEQADNE